MALSEETKKKWAEDIFDTQKVNVYCGTHFYFGGGKKNKMRPAEGCAKCWFVYLFYDIATAPPHERYERLNQLEEVIHHCAEAVESGMWDINVTERAEVKIEKDALPD